MNAPCKGCPYRAIGCHSTCGPYATFKAGKAQANQRRMEQMAAEEVEITGKKRRARSLLRGKREKE